MEAPKLAMTTSAQPQAVQMNAMNPPERQSTQGEECQHKRGLAARLRGGGAGRDCFLGLIECFLCFGTSSYMPLARAPRLMFAALAQNAAKTAANVSLTSSAAHARCAVKLLRLRRQYPGMRWSGRHDANSAEGTSMACLSSLSCNSMRSHCVSGEVSVLLRHASQAPPRRNGLSANVPSRNYMNAERRG
ncbi:hypothetical protein C8Q79DRAFT_1117372 [Trametes meyenii]|nr:hypothetical protein C8Q79DRAFT_1117372 [Trametes meyenii]